MLKTFRDYAVIFIISYQFLKVKGSVRRAKSFVSLVMVDILPFGYGSRKLKYFYLTNSIL